MSGETISILILASLVGFYMAYNIGANDVANSMASAVGAKAITLRQALFIAAVLNFVGAAFLGSHVTETLRKGIIDPAVMGDARSTALCLMSALFSASLWVFLATAYSMPVSTTHAIVGSLLGIGLLQGGVGAVHWGRIIEVVASWIISPFFSCALAYIIYRFIRKKIVITKKALRAAVRYGPYLIGLTFFVVGLSFFYKTPLGKGLGFGLGWSSVAAAGLAVVTGLIGVLFIRRLLRRRRLRSVEDVFRGLQIMTSSFVAMSQGANDVANAMGPLAGIYFAIIYNNVSGQVEVPWTLLAVGGLGIAVGVVTMGRRVITTLGERITTLTNTRGFSVEFGAATTVLLASNLGLPVSTTHAAVGGIIGVGLARGLEAVDFRVVWKIMLYWVITVPIAALTCVVIYKLLRIFY